MLRLAKIFPESSISSGSPDRPILRAKITKNRQILVGGRGLDCLLAWNSSNLESACATVSHCDESGVKRGGLIKQFQGALTRGNGIQLSFPVRSNSQVTVTDPPSSTAAAAADADADAAVDADADADTDADTDTDTDADAEADADTCTDAAACSRQNPIS